MCTIKKNIKLQIFQLFILFSRRTVSQINNSIKQKQSVLRFLYWAELLCSQFLLDFTSILLFHYFSGTGITTKKL